MSGLALFGHGVACWGWTRGPVASIAAFLTLVVANALAASAVGAIGLERHACVVTGLAGILFLGAPLGGLILFWVTADQLRFAKRGYRVGPKPATILPWRAS